MAAGCRGDASALGARMKGKGPRFSCGFVPLVAARAETNAGRGAAARARPGPRARGRPGGREAGREGKSEGRARPAAAAAAFPEGLADVRALSAASNSAFPTPSFVGLLCFFLNCHSLRWFF